ncbi:hypothetical protein V1514DRAFT_336991 [Lipomyces japonicus]|uniref:uncharacterized protein n=1 Tax=Lipomyces japonicus TaxID=56871 RepID=UPI0034CDEA76
MYQRRGLRADGTPQDPREQPQPQRQPQQQPQQQQQPHHPAAMSSTVQKLQQRVVAMAAMPQASSSARQPAQQQLGTAAYAGRASSLPPAAASQRRHLPSQFPIPPPQASTPATPILFSSAAVTAHSKSFSSRDDGGLKVYYMTPPAELSPLLKDSADAGYPDFFPYSGNHAEDNIVEAYIQHGFEDKPFLSNETGSARQNLYASLWRKNSLSSLSSFMLNAMNRRHNINKIKSQTTFKPPPRVTLTDVKREAWLKDLASPAVPLRRLSRTIPHGIRNKVLIEQCVGKNVPINRAVWFARCVGANELRGLKRKGNNASVADAEWQWIRDWTVQLTNVLDKLCAECAAKPDDTTTKWRSRFAYVMNFATHLYSEDLIDRGYFLDWTVQLLHATVLDRVPVALVLTHLFWSQIIKDNRKSKKLAEALVFHVKEANIKTASFKLYNALLEKLAQCVGRLLLDAPEAFIIPESWHGMRPVLQKCMHIINASGVDRAFESVARANLTILHQESATCLIGNQSRDADQEQRQRLLVVLKNSSTPYDVDQVSDELLLALSMPPATYDGDDDGRLVLVVSEWAVCDSGAGSVDDDVEARLSLVTSILKKWTSMGKGIFEALFSLFDAYQSLPGLDLNLFKIFLSQLLDKHVFTPDVYIRKVISRGIFLFPEMQSKIKCHEFILHNLALDNYSNHLKNQRDYLLANAGMTTM